MGDTELKTDIAKLKLLRCVDWLQKQNDEDSTKLSLQNKNDIQFIIQTNAARKNFLLAAAEDEASVPTGVGESSLKPKSVSLQKLRFSNLSMECEWQSCKEVFINYIVYQEHVRCHASEVHVIENESGVEFVCLWDICGYKTSVFRDMVRHMNYHAYHGKLLAIGYNGRATLKLARCKKDSTTRNQFPIQKSDYCCRWFECEAPAFNSIQNFFDHVKVHTEECTTKFVCTWAGCGAVLPRRSILLVHLRTHTGERLIACYHCGKHFANNRKLTDHLRRQNVYPNSRFVCELCGTRCATEYLLSNHTRQHISMYACTLCDMSATTPAALAHHVRYRHLTGEQSRPHACPKCPYRAVTNWDLRKHIKTHGKNELSDKEMADDDDSVGKPKKIAKRKYVCHMCPEKQMQIFSRGNKLTTHLVKIHGAQWSFGHSRFRYQLCGDGMYRLTTTRYESLEVSKKIVDGYTGPKELQTNLEFSIKQVAEHTATTPRRYEITLKNQKEENVSPMEVDGEKDDKDVEITMCDVDEKGNIISTEVIKTELVYRN